MLFQHIMHMLDNTNHIPDDLLSLSTIVLNSIVLNSRDWSEIIWLPEISRFEINLAIDFIR